MRAILTALLVCLALPAAALRSHTFRWMHPDPSVVSEFAIAYGVAPGSHPTLVVLGKPTPDASGIYSATIPIPDGDTYAVARARGLAASDGTPGAWSVDSEFEKVVLAQGSAPSLAITAIDLWASSGSTFTSGARVGSLGDIPASTPPCRGIIATATGAASARLCLDGVCIIESGTLAYHGNGSCVAALGTVGSHTFTATPYSGSGASGSAGATEVRSFQVLAATLPPPGKPKKPRPGPHAGDAAMWTLTAPTAICTEPVSGATGYVWTDADSSALFAETDSPKLPLLTGNGGHPRRFAVIARSSDGGESPPSDPSDPIQVVQPTGSDLNGSGSVTSMDYSMVFAPAFKSGAISCAPVGGVSPCGC